MPATAPPWARIVAYDLNNKGSIKWAIPIGIVPELAARGIRDTGNPEGLHRNGLVATAGGLLFIGTHGDRTVRAIDKATGAVLWEHALPAAPTGMPAVRGEGTPVHRVLRLRRAGREEWTRGGARLLRVRAAVRRTGDELSDRMTLRQIARATMRASVLVAAAIWMASSASAHDQGGTVVHDDRGGVHDDREFQGRRAWVVENGRLEVTLLRGGGHIASIRLLTGDLLTGKRGRASTRCSCPRRLAATSDIWSAFPRLVRHRRTSGRPD